MTVTVFVCPILIDCYNIFTLLLISIEKIYQELRTVPGHFSKHLEVYQKCSTAHLFQLSSQCLLLIKHDLSCLIYYYKIVLVQLWSTYSLVFLQSFSPWTSAEAKGKFVPLCLLATQSRLWTLDPEKFDAHRCDLSTIT